MQYNMISRLLCLSFFLGLQTGIVGDIAIETSTYADLHEATLSTVSSDEPNCPSLSADQVTFLNNTELCFCSCEEITLIIAVRLGIYESGIANLTVAVQWSDRKSTETIVMSSGTKLPRWASIVLSNCQHCAVGVVRLSASSNPGVVTFSIEITKICQETQSTISFRHNLTTGSLSRSIASPRSRLVIAEDIISIDLQLQQTHKAVRAAVEFGDGHRNLDLVPRSFKPAGFIVTDSHTYSEPGVYRLSVYLYCLTSLSPNTLLVDSTTISLVASHTVNIFHQCSDLAVRLSGVGPTIESPVRIDRTKSIFIRASVSRQCQFYRHKRCRFFARWSVYRLLTKHAVPSARNEVSLPPNVKVNGMELSVPGELIGYGTFLIRLKVTRQARTGGQVLNEMTTDGWLAVVPAPCSTSISPSKPTYFAHETVHIYSSVSCVGKQTTNVAYDWYCIRDSIALRELDNRPQAQSCFSNGSIERLMTTTGASHLRLSVRELSLTPAVEDRLTLPYCFLLRVTLDGGAHSVSSYPACIRVSRPPTPHLSVTCLSCDDRVTTTLRLMFRCENCDAKEKLSLHWSITALEPERPKQLTVEELKDQSPSAPRSVGWSVQTNSNVHVFVVSYQVLYQTLMTSTSQFTIALTARRFDGTKGRTTYDLVIPTLLVGQQHLLVKSPGTLRPSAAAAAATSINSVHWPVSVRFLLRSVVCVIIFCWFCDNSKYLGRVAPTRINA